MIIVVFVASSARVRQPHGRKSGFQLKLVKVIMYKNNIYDIFLNVWGFLARAKGVVTARASAANWGHKSEQKNRIQKAQQKKNRITKK